MDEALTGSTTSPQALEPDGERFMPEHMQGGIALEHFHRYAFATQFTAGKVVLDIASGEGYGSAYLAASARHVVGVDISPAAVAHARAKYSNPNLEYRVGNCSAIPVDDHSVDVVVSFETIEHHAEHQAMMEEIKRVLRPGGVLVISSPDKLEYSDTPKFRNPFHVKELYRDEFEALLQGNFRRAQFFAQRVMLASVVVAPSGSKELDFRRIGEADAPTDSMPAPLYWIAVASDRALPKMHGGLFEQPLDKLWGDVAKQKNAQNSELIKLVAETGSPLLQETLRGVWYLQNNPDIVDAGVDPYEHWLNLGASEGRLPAADLLMLARQLLSERDALLRSAAETQEREVRHGLELEIERIRAKGVDDLNTQLCAMAERERTLSHQAAQLQEAAAAQISALVEQQKQREDALRVAINEKERELHFVQEEARGAQRMLEAELDEVRLGARNQLEAQLSMSAERERVVSGEIAAMRDDYARREDELRGVLQRQENDMRRLRQDAAEKIGNLENEVVQARINARCEVDAAVRALADQERTFSQQLAQMQEAANCQLSDQREANENQFYALTAEHRRREEELRFAIDEKDAELRILREREHAGSRQVVDLQDIASRERLRLSHLYCRLLSDVNAKLFSIHTSWSWRVTAPFRGIFGHFLGEPDVKPMAQIPIDALLTPTIDESLNHNSSMNAAMDANKVPGTSFYTSGVSTARTLDELLSYDDAQFVSCAYLTLLGRAADRDGMNYYLGRLKKTGDKLGLLSQLRKGGEAKRYDAKVDGLGRALRWHQWSQIPVLGRIFGRRRSNLAQSQFQAGLYRIERRLAALHENIEPGAASQGARTKRVISANELFLSFDPQKYLECNTDVAAAGVNPYEHFMQHGFFEGRVFAESAGEGDLSNLGADTVCAAKSKLDEDKIGDDHAPINADDQENPDEVVSYFMEAAEASLQGDGYVFTRLMHYLWTSRLDLQNVFDIHDRAARLEFSKWFLANACDEYGLPPEVYPDDLLRKMASLDGDISETAKRMLRRKGEVAEQAPVPEGSAFEGSSDPGANLIGYAFGEFGMGEHVRMVARSLHSVGAPFCIIDQDVGLHGAGDDSVGHWVVDTPAFDINVFHINADVFPPLYFKFGRSFFSGRYNIGYWAWELGECPAEFETALNMVQEVWAISEFVAESFKTRAAVPVVTMPLAVTVPPLEAAIYTKAHYGLPEDCFAFYYTFDPASYLDRKNPIAVVRAFRLAFPTGAEKAHLVFKTMNTDRAGLMWTELLAEIDGDPRITVLRSRMTREEVLGLNLACDAFVSLHRAEGFGRCVAEAMAYGKPAIATNYSGTRDFAKEGTACVVDYTLVPVSQGAYPFWKGQMWAEPSVEHAAFLMRRLANDREFYAEIALAGQRYVLENFNEDVLGALYAKRLDDVRNIRNALEATKVRLDRNYASADSDEILGHIDLPHLGQCDDISDVLSIEGWATSRARIRSIEIYVDSELVGSAHHGVLRPDIHAAFPEMADAATSGFCYRVDVSRFSKGNHWLTVIATSRSGLTKEWRLEICVTASTRYQRWIEQVQLIEAANSVEIASDPGGLYSLVTRLQAEFDRDQLLQTLEALAGQKYSRFELVFIADESVRLELLDTARRLDLQTRVRFFTNSAIDWASIVNSCAGEFIGIVEPGDVLSPAALSNVNDATPSQRQVGLVYGDEDQIRDGVRCDPVFKPAWSPVFLERFNYIGRPWFARKDVLARALENVELADGEINEHTLLREIGKVSGSICHIPSVLVSRSSGASPVLPGRAAIQPLPTRNANMPYPGVSVIIPTCLSDLDVIDRCFKGLVSLTDYPELEVIVVVNNVADESLVAGYLDKWQFRVLRWDKPFSWSGINNYAAANATGDLLLFMNDDVEPLDNNWLKVMVNALSGAAVGAVGARLHYPNGTIQHLGINFVNYGGGARHLLRFCTGAEDRLQWLTKYPREVSAVTGACLLTTRECFNEVGGFDEELPLVCNDSDFCLRVLASGYSIILQPEATLIHHEGISRAGMPEVSDVKRFWEKWESVLMKGDQFTNPNLDSTRDDWVVDPVVKGIPQYRISTGK